MIDDKTVEHISILARIQITEKEKKKFQEDLSSILSYIDKLNEVNTDTVKPLYQITGLVNSMRADNYRGVFKINEELNSKLIGQAPEKENNFIRVKSVLNK